MAEELKGQLIEQMLDKEAAAAWLNAHGFKTSPRQMARLASNRKLPFRPGPDGRKLFVPLQALEQLLEPNTKPTRQEPQYGTNRR